MHDEYISREAAVKALFAPGMCYAPIQLQIVKDLPAADVAEVVRCKDCAKHYIVLGRDMCARNAQGSEGHWIGLSATVPDGFCHRGVHK